MGKMLSLAVVALLALAWFAPDPGAPAIARLEAAETEPASAPPPDAGNGFATVTLPRARDGHFYTEAQVNGARVRFLVDSGASVVALTRADAQAAGLGASAGEFTALAVTAGGDVGMKPVEVDRIAIGPLVAEDVPAFVSKGELGVSLLGQSFLRRIGKVEIERDEMRLR